MSPVFGVGSSVEDSSGFRPVGKDKDALTSVGGTDV